MFRRFDRSGVLFIGLLAVSFLFATFDVRAEGEGVGNVLREGTQALFSPVQRMATAVTRPVVGFIDGIADVASLRDENDRLSSRVTELESLVRDAEELARRLEELEKINDLEPPGELAAITARIWSNGTSDFDHVRFIDRGSSEGVVKGHPVVDENGLVGRIDLVGENWARVRLITDPRLGIGVRDLATNETGWVSGQGTRPLKLEMFNAGEAVGAGDLIVTDGSRFPPDLTVGIVIRGAEPQAGFSLVTEVDPAIETSRLDFVKVLVGWSPLEAPEEDDAEPTGLPSAGGPGS
jgi:rod shape-determining protein MreC